MSWIGGLKRGRPPVKKPRFGRAVVVFDELALVARFAARRAAEIAAPARGRRRTVGIVAALAEVLRLDVADVQESVAAHAEIDERRLDAGFDVDDHPFVDVAHVIVLPAAFDVQFFEHSVFDDGDAAFLRLGDVDQHFLLHNR